MAKMSISKRLLNDGNHKTLYTIIVFKIDKKGIFTPCFWDIGQYLHVKIQIY